VGVRCAIQYQTFVLKIMNGDFGSQVAIGQPRMIFIA
jgi:hypothetical protein